MSYYKTIKGKKLDAGILGKADSAIAGARDGRISKEDAKALITQVKDGGKVTEIEKKTLLFAVKNYKWTDSAKSLLEKEVGKLKTAQYKTIGGVKMDAGILGVAAQAVKGSGDGRISLSDAKKILKEAKDGGRITDIERNTLSYAQKKFKWTDKALAWFSAESSKV